MLEFRILGPLEVVDDGRPVALGRPKQRATLAILLLSANQVVPVERLADDLYAGAPPVTAVNQVQRQVSGLRRALGSESVIETRLPGYRIRVTDEQLDLSRFERLSAEAADALVAGTWQPAADLLREALALWRGPPLADLAYSSFAQGPIQRLDELRLAALEQRIDAELALGRHRQLVAELEQAVAQHPLNEGLRRQLMLALYRSGRQAEALDVYRRTRAVLVEELGIEPSTRLVDLQRAILAHDPSLELDQPAGRPLDRPSEARTVLALPDDPSRLDSLLAITEPLATLPEREVIVASLVGDEADVSGAAAAINERRATFRGAVRTAAFATRDWARDAGRLIATYDVDLVLLDRARGIDADQVPAELATILERSPADVAIVTASAGPRRDRGVYVPFGGSEHDWAALELGAWFASAAGVPLRLAGTRSDPRRARPDASRLLAHAALAIQRVVGVETEPLLAEPSEHALVEAVEPAGVVVTGISPRWRRHGIGAVRRALVRDASPPVVLVHHGPRPGGLAPREARSRFTWSLAS